MSSASEKENTVGFPGALGTPPSVPTPSDDSQIELGDLLSSGSCMYGVQAFLGEGGFGKVAKCSRNLDTDQTVAVKIFKNNEDAIVDAEYEMTMLKKLSGISDKANFVQYHDYFMHMGHPCLVFEMLDMSLSDYIERRDFTPVKEIRPIITQLAMAFKALKKIGMIHGDLKPENVMLVDHVHQPLRVKLIDFGLSINSSDAQRLSGLQTIYWRSPEMMLGLPYSEAIDMWSLGIVMTDLFLGYYIYPGHTEYEMMRYITQTQGQPAGRLLNAGENTRSFFRKQKRSGRYTWRLKTPEEYSSKSGVQALERRHKIFTSLNDLKKINLPEGGDMAEKADIRMFVKLLQRMLTLDAKQRITPSQALNHPFITMSHLLKRQPDSTYVNTCSIAMDICEKRASSFDSSDVESPVPTSYTDEDDSNSSSDTDKDETQTSVHRKRKRVPVKERDSDQTAPPKKRKVVINLARKCKRVAAEADSEAGNHNDRNSDQTRPQKKRKVVCCDNVDSSDSETLCIDLVRKRKRVSAEADSEADSEAEDSDSRYLDQTVSQHRSKKMKSDIGGTDGGVEGGGR